MNSGYVHPMMADASLPLSVPNELRNEMLRYQIVSAMGKILRQGTFKGSFVYISTRLLPKGERFLLRIVSNESVLHEGKFETCQDF